MSPTGFDQKGTHPLHRAFPLGNGRPVRLHRWRGQALGNVGMYLILKDKLIARGPGSGSGFARTNVVGTRAAGISFEIVHDAMRRHVEPGVVCVGAGRHVTKVAAPTLWKIGDDRAPRSHDVVRL